MQKWQVCLLAIFVAFVAGACAKPTPTQTRSIIAPSSPVEQVETSPPPAPVPAPSVSDASTQQIEPARLAAAGFVEQQNDIAGIDQVLALSSDAPDAGERVRGVVAADLLTTGHDIDIPLNAKVLSFVELFT